LNHSQIWGDSLSMGWHTECWQGNYNTVYCIFLSFPLCMLDHICSSHLNLWGIWFSTSVKRLINLHSWFSSVPPGECFK
jgi:hypothetical protein